MRSVAYLTLVCGSTWPSWGVMTLLPLARHAHVLIILRAEWTLKVNVLPSRCILKRFHARACLTHAQGNQHLHALLRPCISRVPRRECWMCSGLRNFEKVEGNVGCLCHFRVHVSLLISRQAMLHSHQMTLSLCRCGDECTTTETCVTYVYVRCMMLPPATCMAKGTTSPRSIHGLMADSWQSQLKDAHASELSL